MTSISCGVQAGQRYLHCFAMQSSRSLQGQYPYARIYAGMFTRRGGIHRQQKVAAVNQLQYPARPSLLFLFSLFVRRDTQWDFSQPFAGRGEGATQEMK